MSRGPGRWQRAILAAVGEHGLVTLRQLVAAETGLQGSPPQIPRAAEVAALRAARTLSEGDRIVYTAMHACRRCFYPQTANPYWCQNPQCSGKYADLTYLSAVGHPRRWRLSVAKRRNAWQHIKQEMTR